METKRIVSMLVMLLAGTSAELAIAADEYNLYTPHKVASGRAPSSPEEGVLTRTITIKRGDTLWGLSRKYTGMGSYYPQILPFNMIENPNLIYAGASLQVPVARGTSAEASAKPAKRVQATTGTKAGHKPTVRKEKQPKDAERSVADPAPAVVAPAAPAARPVAPAAASESGSQRDYQRAVTIYKKGEYREALDAFDAFLTRYPDSPFAPDATLYRADCYMKLSER